MIRLARLSIRRPRAALAFWAIFAVVFSLLGLGVSDSLSPSISVVPGSESSRAQTLSESEFGPSVLVPILLEGPAAQLDRPGSQARRRAEQARRHARDVRLEHGRVGTGAAPAA